MTIIPEDLYQKILQMMPIPCVDLIVSDEQGYVLLVKRNNEPAFAQWWYPGGRVYYKELRANAALRKLKEECNLEAVRVEEVGTYDVVLDMPSGGFSYHGVTTLFHVRVSDREIIKLDNQGAEADWRTPQAWKKEVLHAFIRQGLNECFPNAS